MRVERRVVGWRASGRRDVRVEVEVRGRYWL